MNALRSSLHYFPLLEILETRTPTGSLLPGGFALAGLDAVAEVDVSANGSLPDLSSPTRARSLRIGAESAGETLSEACTNDSHTLEPAVTAPPISVQGAQVPQHFRSADISLPAGLRERMGTAPIPLRLEQIDDSPAPDALLPKNRPDLRSSAADVRRGPYVSVQVNVDANGLNIVGDAANEPSMAVNRVMTGQPLRRQQVVIGWRQFDTIASNFRQAGYNRSTNGGQSWKTASVLQPGVWRSDPVLASSRDGHFYYLSLDSSLRTNVFVSGDGGASWSAPHFAYGGDKPWLTVDKTGRIGDGNLYQYWGGAFSRSVDGGVNWSVPSSIPQSPYWGTMDVALDGTLYVVGVGTPTGVTVAKSIDAKDPSAPPTFSSATATIGGGIVYGGAPNPGGLGGQPWIAVDRSGGPTKNNIYVLASVNPSGSDPLDVHFIRSTDGGSTWSDPLRVNDDRRGNNAWQWFGTMSVAPNGRIDAVWNDTRHSLSDSSISESYYAYSTDGGQTFSKNIQLTPAWDSHVGWPNQNKIGDYYHMVSENHSAALAYSATFNGEQDVYFLRIGDCNNNFVHDGVDIGNGHSQDADQDLIPDECE